MLENRRFRVRTTSSIWMKANFSFISTENILVNVKYFLTSYAKITLSWSLFPFPSLVVKGLPNEPTYALQYCSWMPSPKRTDGFPSSCHLINFIATNWLAISTHYARQRAYEIKLCFSSHMQDSKLEHQEVLSTIRWCFQTVNCWKKTLENPLNNEINQ